MKQVLSAGKTAQRVLLSLTVLCAAGASVCVASDEAPQCEKYGYAEGYSPGLDLDFDRTNGPNDAIVAYVIANTPPQRVPGALGTRLTALLAQHRDSLMLEIDHIKLRALNEKCARP